MDNLNVEIIPYDPQEEKLFIDIIKRINERGYLTEKESLYVLFFTIEFMLFFDMLNNSENVKYIFNKIDKEYYSNPLSIEHEVVLRRLVKQYTNNEIPFKYINLLKDRHKNIIENILTCWED